ncbi:hypothetical protein [Pelotalea chapellei]|uniref:Uncharacterized protein n=1 Tax=Pelotalea chapellei TaxID=44671 RepID=A0ABS5UB75_9BACT|nr:hypothetical protein [Pelotalea chapellei]MBT1072941.1 hypothetical protein [Pelotalea chapellei]
MSSLIFYTNESQALIATDTLATSNKIPGVPFKFTTKAFIVPHLRMVIAGTGCGGFCDRWFLHINDRMIVKGIVNLDYHTPKNLALLWSSYKKEFSIPDNATTTIFHFGFSEEDQKLYPIMYSSADNFESKVIPYGLSGKPEFNCPESYELPKDFKTMMNSQRELQSSETKENKIYIGGEILLIRLEIDGFIVQSLGRFDDYDSDKSAIYSNYGKV